MIVGTNYFWQKALAAVAKHVASGTFDGPLSAANLVVRLLSAPHGLTRDTVIADLQECDFTGYAAIAPPSFILPYQLPSGAWVLQTDILQFLQTGNTITNTVYGWSMETTSDSGQLLMAEMFAAPIQANAANVSIDLSIPIQMGDPENLLGNGELV